MRVDLKDRTESVWMNTGGGCLTNARVPYTLKATVRPVESFSVLHIVCAAIIGEKECISRISAKMKRVNTMAMRHNRGETMRQKYRICQLQDKEALNIKEFAVVEKDTKNVNSSMLRDDHFDLICEQDYDGKTIARAADAGFEELVEALRTPNMYFIEPYATKIAESVIDLSKEDEDRCIELFFDDRELLVAEIPVDK
jgi:hypothetical protein